MPTEQRGEVFKRKSGATYTARWYDDQGVRRQKAGFRKKGEAWDWIDEKRDEVEALRRGDAAAVRRREMVTLAQLVDEFAELREGVVQDNTLRTLKARLRYATEGPALDGK